MKEGIIKKFSIMPLNERFLNELCDDIKEQCDAGITECPMFMIPLHPEGTPPVNKAEIYGKKFRIFKQRLEAMGYPAGILVQSTIGHGYTLGADSPFEKYVNLNDGEKQTVCCPYDDNFCDYIKNAFATLASEEPKVMMVDDDFRLMYRSGNGCACERHMKRFRELSGTNISRSELFEALEHNHKEYKEIYLQTQKEAILKSARAIRDGIDSVDPKIPVVVCASGNCEFTTDVAAVLSGKDNPIVVRVANGVYVPQTPREITGPFSRAAAQLIYLRDKADLVIGEADTVPFNQYGMSAQFYHMHYVGSVLEGVNGAKRWITRLISYEPKSGVAYRKLLKKYDRFYEELIRIVPELEYFGCRIPLSREPVYNFTKTGWDSVSDGSEYWASKLLERIGLPLYFSDKNTGIAFLCGDADLKFSDDEIRKMLSGIVVLSSDCAENLIKRGFADELGISIQEWDGATVNAEQICQSGAYCQSQVGIKQLVLRDKNAEVISNACNTLDKINYTVLFPSAVVFRNSLGGKVITFAGMPNARPDYIEGFAFLNESRRESLIQLLSSELPFYYDGCEEVYLKGAYMRDGRLFCSIFNFGYDPLENPRLATDLPIQKAEILSTDGSYREIGFEKTDNGIKINMTVNPVDPVILILTKG